MKKGVSFNDEHLTSDFEREGYVLIKSCCTEEANSLISFINSLQIGFGKDFYYSLLSNSYSTNCHIAKNIETILSPVYKNLFLNYKNRNESFLAKPANDNNELFLHQDWCYTDINHFQTATFWLPLTNTNKSKGGLFAVPRSHNFFNNYVSGNIFTSRIATTELSNNSVDYLETELGDVIVFNPVIFHGSCPNLSNEARTVITSNIFPLEAPFSYYHKVSEEQIIRANLDDDFYYRELGALVSGNAKLSPVETFLYKHKEITPRDISDIFKKD